MTSLIMQGINEIYAKNLIFLGEGKILHYRTQNAFIWAFQNSNMLWKINLTS